jgi:hypothetical protein
MNPTPNQTDVSHEELVRLLQENKQLIQETNKRVKSLETRANIGLAFKLVWFAILLAVPFILFSMVSNAFSARVDTAKAQGTDYTQMMMGLGEVIKLYRGQ